jgi:hypothetical protein
MPAWLEDLRPEYETMGVGELKDELARHLAGTVENIRHMAFIVRRLEELGVDLSDIRSPWLDDLRRVAYGQLLPGVVVAGTTNRRLLQAARALPLPDQQRIANDEPIPVMVLREGIGPEPRLVPPSRMDAWQIKQVFGPGKIRSEVEQVNFLDNPKRQRRRPAQNVVIHKRTQCIVVSGDSVTLTATQLAEYLRELTK